MNACGILVYFALYSSVLWLFVERLGFSSSLIGALSFAIQMPIFVQLWAARHADRHGAKAMMATFLLWGPLTLLPFLFAPELGKWLGSWATVTGVFAGMIGYGITTFIAFAAWAALVRRNVPERRASEMVGRMSQIGMAVSVVATFGFGCFLGKNPELWRFKAIFLFGAGLAILRIIWLKKVRDIEPASAKHPTTLWADLKKTWSNRPFWRLVLFAIHSHITLGILAPFRPLYVKALGCTDWFAVTATLPCILAAYGVVAHAWGILADRYGSRSVYVLAGSVGILGQLVLILPQNNSIPNGTLLLVGLMMYPMAIAGIEAGNTRRLFTVVPQENQSLFMSIMTIAMVAGMAIGGLLGGIFLDCVRPLLPETAGGNWFARGLEYRLLFLLSAGITIAATGYSRRMRDLKEISTPRMLLYMRLRAQRWLMRGRGAALFGLRRNRTNENNK